MIGDRINATVATQLEKGLPDGQQIDNLVAWLTNLTTKIYRIVEGWEKEGEIVVEVKAPIGPPIQLKIKLPPQKT